MWKWRTNAVLVWCLFDITMQGYAPLPLLITYYVSDTDSIMQIISPFMLIVPLPGVILCILHDIFLVLLET